MKIKRRTKNARKELYKPIGKIDFNMNTVLAPVPGLPGVMRHQPMEHLIVHEDKNIGVSATTAVVYCQHSPESWEARQAVALLGSSNMNDEEIKACGNNPFHPDFHDNYVHGFGPTMEAALAAMQLDAAKMSESLWV
jgi:hypothetical protein